MHNKSISTRYFGLFNKLIVVLVIGGMISSTGAFAFPEPLVEMLNPVPPEGYEILGPHRLTFEDARSDSPNILIDEDDNIHLIWSDTRNDPNPNDISYQYEIFYKKYDKYGNVMVGDTRLTDATTINQPSGFWMPGPSVALDSDGNIHMGYQDYTKHFYAGYYINPEIYYIKLAGDLDTGGAPADLSDLALIYEQRVSQGLAHSGSTDIALDSEDNVHIVWYDHRSAYWNWEIYYEKLTKNGAILIDDKRLTYYLDYCAGPEIAVDSEDNLHVAFKSYRWGEEVNYIYYMKLDNDANELVSPKVVTSEGKVSSRYGKGYPLLAVDSTDKINMVWHDERDGDDNEIYFLKLSNTGDPLMTEPIRLTYHSGDSEIQAFAPLQSMVMDPNDRMFLGWRDNTPGNYQLFIAILNSDGSFCLEPYQVTVTNSLTETPSFAFDSKGDVHIAFMDTYIGDIPEVFHIVLALPTIELAFVPTGVGSASVDITLYEDSDIIDELAVTRTPGRPADNYVTSTLRIAPGSSYSAEFSLNDPTSKKNGHGAVPVKVYLVENGELTRLVAETVLNNNAGKNPKSTATIELDDIISAYI